MPARRELVRAIALSAVLALSGCYHQRVAVTLFHDGSGKLRLEQSTRASGADEVALEELVAELAAWDGLAAWSEVDVRREGDRVAFAATGWFEDVRRVTRDAPDGIAHRFSFAPAKASSGEISFAWTCSRELPAGLEWRRTRALAGALCDLEVEGAVVMPGALAETKSSREVFARTARRSFFSGRELEIVVGELDDQVAANELSEEEAARRLGDRLRGRTLEARCRATGVDPDYDAFRAGLAAARSTWELDGELRPRVEAKRRPAR